MEATTLSVGKSVLDGALGYANSALAEEVALQLGIQRDHAFIRDELQMMQAFLMVAHEERDQNKVLMTWVKQVRDVAYDAEDYLHEFSIHLKQPSCWRHPCTLLERRRIATKMKELRARVEDVNQRNLRYQLIKGSGSKPSSTAAQVSSITASTVFAIDEARNVAKQDKPKGDLVDLISKEGEDLRVIAVCGTNGDVGVSSIVNAAYENPDIKKKFSCRAWVRVMHPFNRNDFIHSLVKQFRPVDKGVATLLETDKTGQELAVEFTRYVNDKTYLIVLNDLFTFEEWNGIKTCFPNNKKGSRIVICAQQVEVARLCAAQQVSELKQLSSDQTIYAFYAKDSRVEQTKLLISMSSSNEATNEISGNQSKGGNGTKLITSGCTRIETMVHVLEESQIIGRGNEKSDMIELISNQFSEEVLVISVWGMGGLGKTTLIKDVYRSQNLISMFEKRAFVTIMRPFNLKELLKSLIMQLNVDTSEKKVSTGFHRGAKNTIAEWDQTMQGTTDALIKELAKHLEGKKCLIVVDDLSTTAEWDQMIHIFLPILDTTSRIVVTTREESIAKHCSRKQENIYQLKFLEHDDALDLFRKKVFMEVIDLDNHPELIKEAKLILKKCSGLPLAIVTIGGFLANQPKTAMKWRKLNEHISAELEMNPELESIRTVLGKSYDGLPYHLKSCFLYLSIFPEDHKVIRRRLIRRWAAEGYSREIRGKSKEQIADDYFMELIARSMILPSQESIRSRKRIESCQLHDLMREISITKSTEENLVFRLEEGCSSNTQGMIRHIAISGNWNGDRIEFENIVNACNIRSLTVFGKFRPFFISEKMRMLRVLDLEGTIGLVDHHLEHIGKLLHLRYLSLRGCSEIYYLPHSLGNLRQLETLDIKGTRIIKLPKAINRLRKLQYLRAGSLGGFRNESYEEFEEDMDLPKLVQNKICLLTLCSAAFCVACCALKIVKESWDSGGDPNRSDVCTLFCCTSFPSVARCLDPHGVVVSSGLKKLTALDTLGTVNIGRGKAALQDIKRLTRLRKLGVVGVNKENGEEFCSTLSTLSNLESLSVRSPGKPGLDGLLVFDGLLPPENLRSLKLEGNLVKLPGWVNGLHNLVKLSLKRSMIAEQDTAMQILGNLPNLTLLRLQKRSFQGDGLRFTFHAGAFPNLMVLELFHIDGLESVDFEATATPKLELLSVSADVKAFSGLSSLQSLKEVLLEGGTRGYVVQDVQGQLERNSNKPVLKSVY